MNDDLNDDDRRPYAPAANVTAVIDRVRQINLPDAINPDFLRVTGIPEGSLGRVAFALQFLGLTDVNGRPSDRLRAMAKASEDEYIELLQAVVREAYAADFARVSPAIDAQPRIISAFKRYEPRSQTTRMVMLFLGLCRAAGIDVLDAPRDRQMQAAARMPAKGRGPRPPARTKDATTQPQPSITASQQAPSPRHPDTMPAPWDGFLFGVTVEDIGALGDEDFREVWSALGKVARVRGKRALELPAAQPVEDDDPAD